ncbi:StbB family protein [Paraburkholderia sp. HD33-4]|uniref:StbB family protein n=1 Tax=Paraburkholderia sp. HD33-4 TaxID=2883242 RepID=UPI001F4192AE|nr:StbB family protein [Paraburkholderia sp. HD33-4]
MRRRHSNWNPDPNLKPDDDRVQTTAIPANPSPEPRSMKIAVMNHSGNVGKTTITHHVLAPRLEGAVVISVESINSDGSNTAALRGSQFDEVQDRLMSVIHAVVDVGASNVEDFIMLMNCYDGSHADYDRFIIPTVSGTKQQVDTISTLETLKDIGVPPQKIRVVFNMVDPKEDLNRSFARLFDAVGLERWITLNARAVIYENPIFEKIKGTGKTIADIRNDPADYLTMNAEAIESGLPEDQRAYIRQMVALKRLAVRVTSELDMVFRELVQ